MRRMFSKNQLEVQTEELLASGNLPSVKANEIIENMSGYSFEEGAVNAGLTKEFVYAGVVKNGNKITFVVALNLTRTDTVLAVDIGNFILPHSIMEKIYPSRIGGYDYVSVGEYSVWSSDATSKNIQLYSLKDVANDKITIQGNVTPIGDLTANTKYYCRWELTLLLSENLID